MPFGKITITPDDIPTLVGIPVMGRYVSLRQRITDSQELLVSLLGVSPGEAKDELGLAQGNSVRLEWLRSKFCNIKDDASD